MQRRYFSPTAGESSSAKTGAASSSRDAALPANTHAAFAGTFIPPDNVGGGDASAGAFRAYANAGPIRPALAPDEISTTSSGNTSEQASLNSRSSSKASSQASTARTSVYSDSNSGASSSTPSLKHGVHALGSLPESFTGNLDGLASLIPPPASTSGRSITSGRSGKSKASSSGSEKSTSSGKRRRRSAHPDRRYACPECEKDFSTSGHLSRHRRIHRGEKRFNCLYPGCEAKFNRQDNMTQHLKTHYKAKSSSKHSSSSSGAPSSSSKHRSTSDKSGNKSREAPAGPEGYSTLSPQQPPAFMPSTFGSRAPGMLSGISNPAPMSALAPYESVLPSHGTSMPPAGHFPAPFVRSPYSEHPPGSYVGAGMPLGAAPAPLGMQSMPDMSAAMGHHQMEHNSGLPSPSSHGMHSHMRYFPAAGSYMMPDMRASPAPAAAASTPSQPSMTQSPGPGAPGMMPSSSMPGYQAIPPQFRRFSASEMSHTSAESPQSPMSHSYPAAANAQVHAMQHQHPSMPGDNAAPSLSHLQLPQAPQHMRTPVFSPTDDGEQERQRKRAMSASGAMLGAGIRANSSTLDLPRQGHQSFGAVASGPLSPASYYGTASATLQSPAGKRRSPSPRNNSVSITPSAFLNDRGGPDSISSYLDVPLSRPGMPPSVASSETTPSITNVRAPAGVTPLDDYSGLPAAHLVPDSALFNDA